MTLIYYIFLQSNSERTPITEMQEAEESGQFIYIPTATKSMTEDNDEVKSDHVIETKVCQSIFFLI